MSEDPDLELVERAQAELPYGMAAYNALVRRHSSAVFRRCNRILRSREDAEEATQDTFLAVYRGLPSFRFERPYAHWLGTVTLNACRMILRRRSREDRRRDALARETQLAPPARGPADPLLRDRLLELLDELDPGTRIPLVLRYVEQRSYAEIAREMELGESAVKMRVSRGAARLRELYDERLGQPAPAEENDPGGE